MSIRAVGGAGPVNTWALILAKSIHDGKLRLAPVLDEAARQRLNRDFLLHTLDVAGQVVGSVRTAVISTCPQVLQLAAGRRAQALRESPACGMNGAASQGVALLRQAGAARVLLLPVDMPRIQADDLIDLIAQATNPAAVVIGPDRHGQGTNALLVPTSGPMQFCFGENSLALHIASARAAGFDPVVHANPAIGADVDTPADLAEWWHAGKTPCSEAGPAPGPARHPAH